MAFLSEKKLNKLGFKHLGKNVLISDLASFYNPKNISIGDNTRIDDFCVLSAGADGIFIGNNIHLSVHVSILGKAKTTLEDFSAISVGTTIFTSNDDYSGNFMTNPTIPEGFKNVTSEEVHLEKHVLIGAGCVILPGVYINQGARVGALSLVKKGHYQEFSLYGGVPARFIKKTSNQLIDLEKNYLKK